MVDREHRGPLKGKTTCREGRCYQSPKTILQRGWTIPMGTLTAPDPSHFTHAKSEAHSREE